MKISRFPFMSSRFARGAAVFLVLLSLAFAAWLFASYNSRDAKMARWKISVEKEIELLKREKDSILQLRKICEDSITGGKISIHLLSNLVREKAFDNCPTSVPYHSRIDSLRVYKNLGYDCEKITRRFEASEKLELIPSVCFQ